MHIFFTSLIVASLLLVPGFNFLSDNSIDYSYPLDIIENGPVRIINNSLGIKTTADSVLIRDDLSGMIIYKKNSDGILPIASITKLITALVILDLNLDWNQEITILEEDLRKGGITRVEAGETLTISNLFNLMLVSSANEAAAALSRVSGIDDFSDTMNKKAVELGMNRSYFADPTGLSTENRSTAEDLIKLADVW